MTLARPADDEPVLRRLDEAPLESLRPKFIAGLNGLIDRIKALSVPPKENPMTGCGLAALLVRFLTFDSFF